MPSRGFLPLTTERLLIRALERRDVTRFTEYRNLPEVWRFQDWDVPYTRDHAHALIDAQEGVNAPVAGEWLQLAIDDGTGLVGDLAVWSDATQQLAMVGYTLSPAAQGRGYATEAVGALVDRLFGSLRVHRVAATLDPANVASARVLERLGFRFEGTALAAALVRNRWEDDTRYAVLADERRAWLDRPTGAPRTVELVEVTTANIGRVRRLAVHHSQEHLVASVDQSLGDALVPEVVGGAPLVPWYRAVLADGEYVGFVMIAERTSTLPEPYLWRLLVDRRHQGRGIGSRIVQLLARRLRDEGETALLTSWVPGRHGPTGFYAGLGFVPTGQFVDGEEEGRLDLTTFAAG